MTVSHHPHGTTAPAPTAVSRLRFALVLTTLVLVVELGGGLLSHSLALVADAGHVITDLFALILAWYAAHQALRPADERRTYGYQRTGILAALVNAATLLLIAAVISFEAYQRFRSPQPVHSDLMLAAAAVGLVVNLLVARRLAEGDKRNLNVRSALLHVAGDAAASAGVIAAAIVINRTGNWQIDPIVSAAIALLIAVGACRIVAAALRILMESTPPGLNVPHMVRAVLGVPGIQAVHDLHVWSISGEMTALSCHILMDDQPTSSAAATLVAVKLLLRDDFNVQHATIEVECQGCEVETPFCSQPAVAAPIATHTHKH